MSGERIRNGRSRLMRREARNAYVFLIPWFTGMAAFVMIPLFASLYFSFTDYSFTPSFKYVGLKNYINLFTNDRSFYQSLSVTFRYVFISVPIVMTLALLLAVLLNKGLKGLGVFRGIYYLPSLIGGSVAISMIWRQVFGAEGIVNRLLAVLGIHMTSWIGSPKYALWSVIILHIWQFGSPMIIFLAALKNIPNELFEAADIDGANSIQKFFRITLPLISPTILFNLIQQIIHSFQAFNQAYIISGGTGGPARSLLFYTLSLYKNAFTNYKMGYASAQAWILLAIIGVFTLISFSTSKKWVYYEV